MEEIKQKAINKILNDLKASLKAYEDLNILDFCNFSKNSMEKIKKLSIKQNNISSDLKNTKDDKSLDDIKKDLKGCTRCKLCSTRKNIVFGAGSPNAKLMIVGEGPGAAEDAQGVPFVGRAGQLLTKILQAINLERPEVYICNIIKCRPPQNRNPEADEILACFPFLERQIKVIKPDFICTLGTFASQTLLKNKTPISHLRGNFYDYMGAKLIPTYHPAYLLRNPSKKRETWEDVQKLQKAMELRALNNA